MERVRKSLRKAKDFSCRHRDQILYGIYNTAVVAGVDRFFMDSVTNWNTYISSGAYNEYKIGFLALRLAPILISGAYYLAKEGQEKAIEILHKGFGVFYPTMSFSEVPYFLSRLENPLSPYPDIPGQLRFDTGNVSSAEFYAKGLALGAGYHALTRTGRTIGNRAEKFLKSNEK